MTHEFNSPYEVAVEVYGAFMEECVMKHVIFDVVGSESNNRSNKIDRRTIRLISISGKGGWSQNQNLATRWQNNNNISLLDHVLSVGRGALMFWLHDNYDEKISEKDKETIIRVAYSVVCIAFLHDIDKDLQLGRNDDISASAIEERMKRYGIDAFLKKQGINISSSAMQNYIERVEGTQAYKNPPATDYDRLIAEACPYVELADKLDGTFASLDKGKGIDGVVKMLERWPLPQSDYLKQWEKIEIHDHLHFFLLDRFHEALSNTCSDLTGFRPLIEIVHDGTLLCVIPKADSAKIKEKALDRFIDALPFKLRFSVNNKLACKFVGAEASWVACKNAMAPTNWNSGNSDFSNLLALPREFAQSHKEEIDNLFELAHIDNTWGGFDSKSTSATVKPAFECPDGGQWDFEIDPVHTLMFLVVMLNHAYLKKRESNKVTIDADYRERELRTLMQSDKRHIPDFIVNLHDGRSRRILVALWTVSEIQKLYGYDFKEAKSILNSVVSSNGLVGRWIEGTDEYLGISCQIPDEAGEIKRALHQRFSAYTSGTMVIPYDTDEYSKRCILSNEPVNKFRNVDASSNAHGIKVSAFSGRDGRNDHLASSKSDTHLSLVSLAELILRQIAQGGQKGKDLPPIISSPTSTGLFGGLVFENENSEESLSLYDFSSLDHKKGKVYEGLACQTKRIRVARLESMPTKEQDIVAFLHRTAVAAQRLGRPIHIFRGMPYRHPAILFYDAIPSWLEKLIGGNSLRIEQLPNAITKLELYKNISQANGLGIEWARKLAEPQNELGALCVAWDHSLNRDNSKNSHVWYNIRVQTHDHARNIICIDEKGNTMKLKNNDHPLIRLAWLATQIQKRRNESASSNKQLLCWTISINFILNAKFMLKDKSLNMNDRNALILGIASSLEEELKRKGDAAARKHRDDKSLSEGCIDYATHFVDEVWPEIFQSKEPTSTQQRIAKAIYRFALLESYRERGVAESTEDVVPEDDLMT